MMKRFLFLLVVISFHSLLWSQHAPIANDDYATGELGKMVTVRVIENDVHPDGKAFKVSGASLSTSFTDSTITFSILYDRYYNITDTISFRYSLIDENGNTGVESIANVFLIINNNNYYNYLDHNNIRARVQASGLQFYQGPIFGSIFADAGVFEIPKGSGKNTIYNSTLWVGGLDENDSLALAAELNRHEGMDYWTGPLSIVGDQLSIETETAVDWQKVWKLSSDQVSWHKLHYWQEGYLPINDIATWPAHGDNNLNQAEFLAPFIDIDGDGYYNPMAGDYPLIRGNQCIYFIINDLRTHTETDGKAMGLEIHGMAYEFYSEESDAMNNTVFYSYKIFNRSAITYHDTYIGLFTDFDIGFSDDDFVGCDVTRGTYYGYNGDSIDGIDVGEEGTYGVSSPAQGITILGGPVMDANGLDDPTRLCDESINGVGFSDGIADNERYGMKKFIWFNKNQGVQGDPKVALDYYNYLQSIWKDRTAMEYGGNGHVNSGSYGPFANFMFPGLSDPCFWGTDGDEPFGPVDWTEISSGNPPGDRRGLSVMGPFTFEAGAMERVDIAYVTAFNENDKTAIESLMEYVDSVRLAYYKNPAYFGYQWLDVDEQFRESGNNRIVVYPNPVNTSMTFSYSGNSKNARFTLSDLTGRILISNPLDQSDSHTIDVSSVKPGLYLLTITNNTVSNTTKVIKQ